MMWAQSVRLATPLHGGVANREKYRGGLIGIRAESCCLVAVKAKWERLCDWTRYGKWYFNIKFLNV